MIRRGIQGAIFSLGEPYPNPLRWWGFSTSFSTYKSRKIRMIAGSFEKIRKTRDRILLPPPVSLQTPVPPERTSRDSFRSAQRRRAHALLRTLTSIAVFAIKPLNCRRQHFLQSTGHSRIEYLRLWQACWAPGKVSFAGRFFSFSDMHINPKPVQQPHPPIWIGGASDAALRRAARFAALWQPTPLPLAEWSSVKPCCTRRATKSGAYRSRSA
jgi:hypothetical protein